MSKELTRYRPPQLPARRREGRASDFAEFLPDAQAVVEREHSPLARTLLFLLSGLCLALIAFISLVEVDQVATAKGVVRPADRVKVINHPVGGRITAILVREGDLVREGAALLEFDPELSQEEVNKLTGDYLTLEAQLLRLESEATGAPLAYPADMQQARPDLVSSQIKLFNARQEALVSRRSSADEIVNQRQEAVRSLESRVDQLRATLGILQEQARRVRELVDKGYFPELRWLSLQRDVSESEGELNQNRSNLAGARAALEQAKSDRESIEREWNALVLDEMASVMTERDRLRSTLEQQRTNLRNLVLHAPADGIVQDLNVSNIGQAVRPSDELMKIVPVGETLVIEAKVGNSDIGYIYEGQPVTVKVDTYDFSKHGTLEGQVERIAADAARDEQTGQLFFDVTVRTERSYLGNDADAFTVTPGMTTTVDMKIGERTILAFLTDRLRQTALGAFQER